MVEMSTPKKLAVYVMTILGAAVIGFGVPLAWVWIGSQLEGGDGVSSVSFTVAVAILFGIVTTYVLMGWIAGWIQARFDDPEKVGSGPPPSVRQPWMRSQSDTRGRTGGESRLRPLEFVFVVTTLVVSGAFWIWFFFFAQGGGLPNP